MLAAALHRPLESVVSAWDAVVVGAGPAGAIAARGLAGAGARVLLLDRRPFPRWKVCGACLGPGAQAVLRAAGLGDLPARLGAQPLRVMVLSGWGRSARIPLGGWAALSREALDSALVAAACRAGAEFRPGARATLGGRGQGLTRLRVVEAGAGRTVCARVVIDATGLGGGLGRGGAAASAAGPSRASERRLGGRTPWPPAPSRVGLGAVFAAGAADVPAGELRMAVGRSGYVGLVRLEDGRVDVAAAVDHAALRGAPPEEAVAAVLREAGQAEPSTGPAYGWRGTPALTRDGLAVASSGLYRVGDVAGYVEPFTGEGIGWALADGAAVAPFALRALGGSGRADAALWHSLQRDRAAASQRLCRWLARALRHPGLVRPALHLLSGAPSLAGPLVRRAARAPTSGVGVPA
jgi:flavin-dependent dehydrogenase